MPDERDPYASKPGCNLSPTMILAIVFAFVWMTVVVPMYQSWRYPKPDVDPNAVEDTTNDGDDSSSGTTKSEPATTGGGADSPEQIAEQFTEDVGVPGIGTAAGVAAEAKDLPATVESTDPALAEKLFSSETDQLALEFTTRGAAVVGAQLVEYRYTPKAEESLSLLGRLAPPDETGTSFFLRAPPFDEDTPNPLSGVSTAVWELENADDSYDRDGIKRVTFRLVKSGLELRKTFVLKRGAFTFDVEIEAKNATRNRVEQVRLELVGPNGIVPDEESLKSSRSGIVAMLAGRDDPQERVDANQFSYKDAASEDILDRSLSKGGRGTNEWAAVRNRFFTVIMQGLKPSTVRGFVVEAIDTTQLENVDERYKQENIRVASRVRFEDLDPTETAKSAFAIYVGPLHQPILETAKTSRGTGSALGWHSLLDYGWFESVSKLLLWLLRLFYILTQHLGSIVGGYGLAIFFLTVALKGALHPLQRKAMISMAKMQKLQPEMKAIRKKYEKDKSMETQRRMQKEIMELYQKHNVSMAGGCGPMLIQLPMFIAFYGMLRGAFELRQASFLWISDLSQPDILFHFGFNIPFIGNSLHLLPILYTGLFLLQQKFQPKSEDPQAQQMQRTMKFMVIFFFFLFYNMPSGLVLYFVFSNAFSLIESWYIRTHLIPASEAKGAAGGPMPTADDYAPPPTSWDKQAAKEAKKADKKKKRDAGGAPPPRFR